MATYISLTEHDKRQMLDEIGLKSETDLFCDVPKDVMLSSLNLPNGISEMELISHVQALANKNKVYASIFRGAGAYNHHIPPIVNRICAKEEFVTSYTPYQAEISQGILQSIFEYQSMICMLTGMDVSNASIYDGASAAAEAVAMCRERKRDGVIVSGAMHPFTIDTIKTYCRANGMKCIVLPCADGVTDISELEKIIDENTACVVMQQPNYFGNIENSQNISDVTHKFGAKMVASVNPIAAALLKTPRECGADIAVGDGQPLGMPLSFGGPYLGFMAATKELARKLPGRIAGQTQDSAGKRCFVLTLQAREQHIRREKASSNVCSNQALCALRAAAYLAAMGPGGMCQTAQLCYNKAHYLATELCKINGVSLKYNADFFHEFVTTVPPKVSDLLMQKLEEKNILGGLPLGDDILWCTTEKNTKEQIDELVNVVREVCLCN